jgi:lipoate-protein ligase A
VAYTSAALVVDHVRQEAGSTGGQDVRFAEFGQRFVDLFRGLGVDARLGAVPGEYCPGAHSVNARGVEKLVGTSQRMVPGAWLFSSLIVVGDESRLRPVLAEVYRCLGQDFDESSVGSLSREVPGLDADTVEASVVDAYRGGGPAATVPVDTDLLELARNLVPQHRVDPDGQGVSASTLREGSS